MVAYFDLCANLEPLKQIIRPIIMKLAIVIFWNYIGKFFFARDARGYKTFHFSDHLFRHDMSHIVQSLNKLDIGSPERFLLRLVCILIHT